jgi:hypothetical protein
MTKDFSLLLIPEEWRDIFDLVDVEEKQKEFLIILHEKKELIPNELQGKEVVSKGFKEPVEIIHFPLNGKLTYLKFFRRRWKKKGERESHSNTYRFHRPGMKTTDAFGDFLKGLNRKEFDEFCVAWPGVRDFWQKDIRLVPKCLEWFRRPRSSKKTS